MSQAVVDYPGHRLHGKRLTVERRGECHGIPLVYVLADDGDVYGLPVKNVRILAEAVPL